MSEEARLAWRSRRGMLELDLLLEAFLQSEYGRLEEEGRAAYRRLLELPDQDLLERLLGLKPTTDGALADVISRIRAAVAP